jgi:hypothetical protein
MEAAFLSTFHGYGGIAKWKSILASTDRGPTNMPWDVIHGAVFSAERPVEPEAQTSPRSMIASSSTMIHRRQEKVFMAIAPL